MGQLPAIGMKYMQLQHFVHFIKRKHNLVSSLTPFEQLCNNSTPQRHVISALHNLLWTDTKADEAHTCKKWEHNLNMEISDTQWEKIHRHIHKSSVNVTIQENSYKILSRWYRTPTQNRQIYSKSMLEMKTDNWQLPPHLVGMPSHLTILD